MAERESGQVFDLSGALDDLFEFETTLKAVSDVEVPHAADAMALAFEDAGDRIEQALTRAARTGEVNFENLVSSILADLARLAANAVLDQVFLQARGGVAQAAPVAINVTMPEGSDAASLISAQGQIASALGQAIASGSRWS